MEKYIVEFTLRRLYPGEPVFLGMEKYIVEFTPDARKDLQKHYKSGNKSVIIKIEKILIELTETPYIGEGKPEELKYHYRDIGQGESTKKTEWCTV